VIEFEPLRRAHLALLREWLGREHVRRWWPDPEQSLRHYEEALAGRDVTEHYLIVVDERPVGMIQSYLVSDNPEWGATIQVEEEGVAGVDLLIGEEEATGRGLGPLILEAFMQQFVFASADTKACLATVEEPNRRSWRAFEKAGFRHVRDVEEDGVPHRLMRLDRRYAQ
jgi:aminoglycoside 6'-N-acetyltransferase